MRNLIVSDLHFGGRVMHPNRKMQWKIRHFFNVIEQEARAGRIRFHCLGDTWDPWGYGGSRRYLSLMRKRAPQMQACLERLVRLDNCTFYAGNHDMRLKKYLPLKDDNYCPEIQMYLVHGNKFTFTGRHPLFGRFLYGVLRVAKALWPNIDKFSLEWHEKRYGSTKGKGGKGFLQDSKWLAKKVAEEMEEHPEYQIYVTGDTHFPLIEQYEDGRYYVNSGNLFERGDVIAVENGVPKITSIDDYL